MKFMLCRCTYRRQKFSLEAWFSPITVDFYRATYLFSSGLLSYIFSNQQTLKSATTILSSPSVFCFYHLLLLLLFKFQKTIVPEETSSGYMTVKVLILSESSLNSCSSIVVHCEVINFHMISHHFFRNILSAGFVLMNMKNPKIWLLLLWHTNAWRWLTWKLFILHTTMQAKIVRSCKHRLKFLQVRIPGNIKTHDS